MAWDSVALIKNAYNEYRFAYIPNFASIYSGGSSGTSIIMREYRGENREPGTVAFQSVLSYVQAIYAQTAEGIFNLYATKTTYDKFLYGDALGEALRLYITCTESSTTYPFTWSPYHYYNNMQSSLRLLTGSSSVMKDVSKRQYDCVTFGLAINHETEECYLMCIISNLVWDYGIGYPRYYDSATCQINVCDGGGKNGFSNLYNLFKKSIPSGGGSNPYEGGGLNDEPAGGEDQNFDETSDIISEPTLPSSPATGSGFMTAYVPTLGEINDVADYLIDPTVLQALAGTVLKLSDVIIGLSIFPFTIAATGSKEVKLNLMGIHLTTGVTCHYSDSQFVTLNMGSIDVKKYWDNCLDFDPYTRISIYLPYVGYVDLDTDEVMGKEITVKYNVDIVTGCCLALIIVDGSVLYQYPGECSCQIPVTSVSFDNFLQSAVQLGITAASGARAVKGAAASVSEAGAGVLTAEGMADTRDALSDYNAARASFSGIKADVGDSLLSASVSAVVNAKGSYSHAGAMSSCAGILGTQKPFLIIKRPQQCMPEGYEGIRGFPCNMKATLGDLEGYTEVGDIHLNIPNATVQEIVECEQFLKEGVYL